MKSQITVSELRQRLDKVITEKQDPWRDARMRFTTEDQAVFRVDGHTITPLAGGKPLEDEDAIRAHLESMGSSRAVLTMLAMRGSPGAKSVARQMLREQKEQAAAEPEEEDAADEPVDEEPDDVEIPEASMEEMADIAARQAEGLPEEDDTEEEPEPTPEEEPEEEPEQPEEPEEPQEDIAPEEGAELEDGEEPSDEPAQFEPSDVPEPEPEEPENWWGASVPVPEDGGGPAKEGRVNVWDVKATDEPGARFWPGEVRIDDRTYSKWPRVDVGKMGARNLEMLPEIQRSHLESWAEKNQDKLPGLSPDKVADAGGLLTGGRLHGMVSNIQADPETGGAIIDYDMMYPLQAEPGTYLAAGSCRLCVFDNAVLINDVKMRPGGLDTGRYGLFVYKNIMDYCDKHSIRVLGCDIRGEVMGPVSSLMGFDFETESEGDNAYAEFRRFLQLEAPDLVAKLPAREAFQHSWDFTTWVEPKARFDPSGDEKAFEEIPEESKWGKKFMADYSRSRSWIGVVDMSKGSESRRRFESYVTPRAVWEPERRGAHLQRYPTRTGRIGGGVAEPED